MSIVQKARDQGNSWDYVILVETVGSDTYGSAGAVVDQKWGLIQTLSFSKEEMSELKIKMRALSLPLAPGGERGMIDGYDGCIKFCHGGSCVDLNWAGIEPQAWEPGFEWISSVRSMIMDKSFEDSLGQQTGSPTKFKPNLGEMGAVS